MREQSKNWLKAVVVALLVLSTFGCGNGRTDVDRTPNIDLASVDLDVNRDKWSISRTGVRDYSVIYQIQCFCTLNGSIQEVFVSGEQPYGAFFLDANGNLLGSTADTLDLMSVETFFFLIEDALYRKAARVEVTYDENLGAPSRIYIDYNERVADDEITYIISGVRLDNANSF